VRDFLAQVRSGVGEGTNHEGFHLLSFSRCVGDGGSECVAAGHEGVNVLLLVQFVKDHGIRGEFVRDEDELIDIIFDEV